MTSECKISTSFDLQCLSCGMMFFVRYEENVHCCPQCEGVDLHVAEVYVREEK